MGIYAALIEAMRNGEGTSMGLSMDVIQAGHYVYANAREIVTLMRTISDCSGGTRLKRIWWRGERAVSLR